MRRQGLHPVLSAPLARRVASALVTGFRAVHDGNMGKLMLGLAMAAVVLRSYIGLSPWKLALLLLSLFVLNLLQVRVRVGAVWRGHVSPCTG